MSWAEGKHTLEPSFPYRPSDSVDVRCPPPVVREQCGTEHQPTTPRSVDLPQKNNGGKKNEHNTKGTETGRKETTCRPSAFPPVQNSPSHDPPSSRSREQRVRMLSLATTDRNAPRLAVPQSEWQRSGTNHLPRSQSKLRRIPCGRCKAVIQHDSRAPWSVVNKLVTMHWEACPGSPHVLLAKLPPLNSGIQPTPFGPSTSPIAFSTTPAHNTTQSTSKRNDSQREFSGPTRNPSSTTAAGWERKRKTEEQRKRELEEDEYTADVTVTSVTCVGCGKQISLDKRSRYYPGLWVKHRNKCPDVEKLKRATKCSENQQLPDAEESVPPPPPSTIASSPAGSAGPDVESVGGHREGESRDSTGAESHPEILHRNNEGNKVMTAAIRVGAPFGGRDWPDPWESDEDEEEETDWPHHISFPCKSYFRSLVDLSDADS
ncbi:hypothetical protein F5141DRAFT_732169 [Pisolithus sp. B1]|nr:hypothetical protein F5141DRAFT_732169 [Pisolithus sp. B1]